MRPSQRCEVQVLMKVLVPALLMLLTAASANAATVEPFQASFTVSRNGKELGDMQMQLSAVKPGEWLFVSRTEGNSGLAGFLGVTIEERSQLVQTESGLSTRSYHYQQDMFGRHRSRQLDVTVDGAIAESDGDKSWAYNSTTPLLDRHAVVLGIAARLAAGADPGSLFDVPVASKGKTEQWRFLVVGLDEIKTGNGRISAVRVERVRENSERTTVSWHSPANDYLPIKVEQTEPDGERLTSLLQSFQQ